MPAKNCRNIKIELFPWWAISHENQRLSKRNFPWLQFSFMNRLHHLSHFIGGRSLKKFYSLVLLMVHWWFQSGLYINVSFSVSYSHETIRRLSIFFSLYHVQVSLRKSVFACLFSIHIHCNKIITSKTCMFNEDAFSEMLHPSSGNAYDYVTHIDSKQADLENRTIGHG